MNNLIQLSCRLSLPSYLELLHVFYPKNVYCDAHAEKLQIMLLHATLMNTTCYFHDAYTQKNIHEELHPHLYSFYILSSITLKNIERTNL